MWLMIFYSMLWRLNNIYHIKSPKQSLFISITRYSHYNYSTTLWGYEFLMTSPFPLRYLIYFTIYLKYIVYTSGLDSPREKVTRWKDVPFRTIVNFIPQWIIPSWGKGTTAMLPTTLYRGEFLTCTGSSLVPSGSPFLIHRHRCFSNA